MGTRPESLPTAPLSVEQVAELAVIKATEPWPEWAAPVINTIYLTTPPASRAAPALRVERVGQDESHAFWQVEVCSQDKDFQVGLPGMSAEQEPLPDLKREPSVRATEGYRPPWIDWVPEPSTEAQVAGLRLSAKQRELEPLVVFNPDRRKVLTDTSYPWSCVGKITTSDGTTGSGALVGPNLMLTASHVVPWKSAKSGRWWMRFTPHLFDGNEPFGHSFVKQARVYRKVNGPSANEFEAAEDYAVLRLWTPLGQRLGWFGTQTYDEDWNGRKIWASVGYPGDIAGGQRPSVELRVSIEDGDSPYVIGMSGDPLDLETEASLNKGASGGPFWAWFKAHHKTPVPRIIGVVSGGGDVGGPLRTDIDNYLGGGSPMVHLVNWALQHWH